MYPELKIVLQSNDGVCGDDRKTRVWLWI